MISPQERDVKFLCPCVRMRYEKVKDLLEDLEPKVFLSTIETLRQPDRQAFYLRKGVSWRKDSLHLPHPPKGLSLAVDCCPVVLLTEKGWNPSSPLWGEVGRAAEAAGLKWGGRWKQKDLGHLELPKCSCKEDGLL